MPYNFTCRISCSWDFVRWPVFWNEQSCGNQIYFHPQITENGTTYWDGSDRRATLKHFVWTDFIGVLNSFNGEWKQIYFPKQCFLFRISDHGHSQNASQTSV